MTRHAETTAILIAAVLIVSVAFLCSVVIRNGEDKVRLTVPTERLLSAVQGIQGACYCTVQATPLGVEDEAKYWVITYNKYDSNS